MYAGYHGDQKRELDSLGAGVTGDCELLNTVAGNWAQVACFTTSCVPDPQQVPLPIFLVRIESSANSGVGHDGNFRGFKIISRTDDEASWGRPGGDT